VKRLFVPTTAYFSRRRARRRASQTSVPDWVWGLGLGLIVLVFVGGFFAANSLGGGGGGGCDEPLAPLGSSQIKQETFDEVDVGLTNVLVLLEAGDRAGAEAAFYGPVHNFTHNVDPPLREVNEDLAKDLCRQVLDVENALSSRASDAEVAAIVASIQLILRDGAEELGYTRPG
jgi:hypothetical protein